MDTVTISLRKYHQYLDYEKFVNEQDSVVLRQSYGNQTLITKDNVVKGLGNKCETLSKESESLYKEVERLKDEVEWLEEKLDDKTLREELEGKANQEALLNEKIFLLENEITELKSIIKCYKDASFLDKLKRLFK